MFTMLSLVTSVKDYVEVVHKLIESDSAFNIQGYSDFGALLSYSFLISKQFFFDFLSLRWIYQMPSLPIIIPNIASAMISEVSVIDGYFHNFFTFLEKPISYGEPNFLFYSLEKFTIGLINSLFLFLPTSTASLISLRRFVIQGVEAGYLSGLGTLCGSLLWIASILFGWRFLVLPWLSLDILRYALGLILLVKYMWDSYTERRVILEKSSKNQIFILTFLLSFTEQTSLFPFLGNLSIGSDATILESFPSNNLTFFLFAHGSYLLGLGIGGLSLLYLTCWFWENPAFRLYTWALSSVKLTTRFNYKFINFTFLYLTMICAMSNVVYFGLDYTLTKPLGFVTNDRLIDQKVLLETSFLSTKASDRNTRMNMGRRGRRERWKKSAQRYRNFDSSLYGEGIYDLFTIEDLNYGFDRFWLRRKMRNHDVPFRLFPGPWVRSFKKQLARPRLESFSGPRLEFFRILFEQVYHPIFHEKKPEVLSSKNSESNNFLTYSNEKRIPFFNSNSNNSNQRYEILSLKTEIDAQKQSFIREFSTIRKFVRKVNKRIKISKISLESLGACKVNQTSLDPVLNSSSTCYAFPNLRIGKRATPIYSKKWKEVFSKTNHTLSNFNTKEKVLKRQLLLKNPKNVKKVKDDYAFYARQGLIQLGISSLISNSQLNWNLDKKADFQKQLSKKDRQILKYRAFLVQSDPVLSNMDNLKISDRNLVTAPTSSFLDNNGKQNTSRNAYKQLTLLHPIQFYLHKEQAFRRKLKFYGANIYRNFGISNNSPYFRIMTKKFFYYYKPTLRWERTMRVATLKKIRRKRSRKPLRLTSTSSPLNLEDEKSESFISRERNLKDSNLPRAKRPIIENYPNAKLDVINEKKSFFQTLPVSQSLNGLQKPTHMYSLIGKRATRYRSQIYKDVLQHWYYSPFNRLLLKLDIDSFIRRQPVSHFLTKNEEHLLHFRRALLMDHYETLRWYTYMQHYRSMKSRIGGTKSFASRLYNQQFQGTFKKVRHLFQITPSLSKTSSNGQTLKWDQPLYHEYPNNQNFSILNDGILHEELLIENELDNSNRNNLFEGDLISDAVANLKDSNLPRAKRPIIENYPNKKEKEKKLHVDDLLNKGKRLIGDYLVKATPIRENLIAHYLREKNYGELTRFLFKGQKTRGTTSTTNQSELLKQEKDYLYTDAEKQEFRKNERAELKHLISSANRIVHDYPIRNGVSQSNSDDSLDTIFQKREGKKQWPHLVLFGTGNLSQNLWVALLKKSQTSVFDRKALKNYLKNKRDTVEKRKKKRQKQLKNRLERIQSWLVQKPSFSLNSDKNNVLIDSAAKFENLKLISGGISTGVQKAVKEAIGFQKGFIKSKRPLWNDFRKNQPETLDISPASQAQRVASQGGRDKNDSKKLVLQKKIKNSLLNIETLIRKGHSHPKQIFKKLKRLSYKTLFLSKKAIKNVQTAFYKKTVWESEDYSLANGTQSFFRRVFTGPSQILNLVKKREKNLSFWKRKQYVLAKRKQTRKVLKPLKKQTNRQSFSIERRTNLREDSNFKFALSQKKDNIEFFRQKRAESSEKNQSEKWLKRQDFPNITLFKNGKKDKKAWNAYNFTQDFQTRRSRRRGSRSMRNRGAIKKPTLNDKLKRQFKILKRYGKKVETKKVGIQIIRENLENTFRKRETKQRRTRQRENRFWRRHKKPKYSQNRRKMKKRKRYSISKLRILTKELKRLESYLKIRKWWWENFLPNFRAQTDTFLEFSKNEKIREKLQSLSFSEIMTRDSKAYENLLEKVPGEHSLQIGNSDYKPLSLPHALAMLTPYVRKDPKGGKGYEKSAISNSNLAANVNENQFVKNVLPPASQAQRGMTNANFYRPDSFKKEEREAKTNVDLLSQNLLNSGLLVPEKKSETSRPEKFMVRVNPIPFYAGWDETLRKFIITNRLLSRREAGYQKLLDVSSFSDSIIKNKEFESKMEISDKEFTQYPLKGMNVATTLYWQVPFTTYDPDQFFALGRDGFAPIGWKRFKFQYIKQTMKPIIVKKKISTLSNSLTFSQKNKEKYKSEELASLENSTLFDKMQLQILTRGTSSQNVSSNISSQNLIHFTQKRNKRIKRHPRSPVSFPSGPLINQVLPVHYIYVFYKRDRLPRDRYISRRLRRSKAGSGPSFAIRGSLFKLSEWTLRKRAKPRRRYHLKRKQTPKITGSPKTILRRAFRKPLSSTLNIVTGDDYSKINSNVKAVQERQRPLAKPKIGTGQQLQERLKERYKQRKKNQSIKSKNENLRIRQLRRRVQRQVYRPVWRYEPHPGGFVWPGDYFRLELIKAPKLISLEKSKSASENRETDNQYLQKKEIKRKVQQKKKRTIQTWQIQPKKYLLQKHNRKVLKKRLENSQSSHKINQKLKELSALV